MTKGIITLVLAITATLTAGTAQTFTGVITDSMCGKNHNAMGATPDAKCVTGCVHANPSRYKYALYDGKSVYVLSDQKTPEQFAARKVFVTGSLDVKTNTIRVASITAVK